MGRHFSILYKFSFHVYRVGNILQRFLTITQLLERVLIEHIDMKNSLDSKLQIYYMCSVEIFDSVRVISQKISKFLDS